MKTAIFGGTFDPIHNGHIHIAKYTLSEFNLDKVIFMPTGNSYMKKDVSPSVHRMNMLKLALESHEEFDISDLEVKREGYTYTKDTVKYFKENNPEDELYFLIGSDTLFMIEKWAEPEYLFDNLIFIVCDRNDEEIANKAEELKNKYNADIRFSKCDFLDISSSEIRKNVIENGYESLNEKSLDIKVINYIKEKHLYKDIPDALMIMMLKNDLKESRLLHTLGVLDTASQLAKAYRADIGRCEKAALLHDCAKYMPMEEKIAICERNFVKISDIEKQSDSLLHSKAGACLAYEKYGIKDPEILDAIKWHTTGRPNMSIIEKIIFVSDFIEPNRTHSDKLPMYRMIAMADIDLVCMNILKDTLDYINSKDEPIDPMTQETYDFYKDLISKRK